MSCCGSQKKEIVKKTNNVVTKVKSSNILAKIGIFFGAIIVYPVFPILLFYIMFIKK